MMPKCERLYINRLAHFTTLINVSFIQQMKENVSKLQQMLYYVDHNQRSMPAMVAVMKPAMHPARSALMLSNEAYGLFKHRTLL